MILYDINKTCMDVSLGSILGVTKNVLKLIQIIGPILCMVGITMTLIKMVSNPDEKKNMKKLWNSIFALFILFFVPVIVNIVMGIMDDSFEFSKCWNYNEEVKNPKNATFISVDDRTAIGILTDPSSYEGGKEKTSSSTGNGMGRANKITIQYNVKDSGGRCGTGSKDRCAEIATVEYPKGTIKYYMGYQNNSGLLGGSCRAHAFTCGMNAVNNTNYSTLDLQNYMKTIDGDGVFKGSYKYHSAINYFNVKAKAYFEETSITESYHLAKEALDNGQPVMIFVASSKCSDLASSHHALLLLGYDNSGNVIFLDSCSRYPSAKKRTLDQLILGCMSGDSIAKNWMRMVIFSF